MYDDCAFQFLKQNQGFFSKLHKYETNMIFFSERVDI